MRASRGPTPSEVLASLGGVYRLIGGDEASGGYQPGWSRSSEGINRVTLTFHAQGVPVEVETSRGNLLGGDRDLLFHLVTTVVMTQPLEFPLTISVVQAQERLRLDGRRRAFRGYRSGGHSTLRGNARRVAVTIRCLTSSLDDVALVWEQRPQEIRQLLRRP